MRPDLDAAMRAMPLSTKADALAYLKAFDQYCADQSPYGAVLGANFKPASVRAPDIFDRANQAKTLAGLHYWQMDYETAKRHFFGLPRKTWEAARAKHGMVS